MSLSKRQAELDYLVQRASELLKAPGKPFLLDSVMEQTFLKSAVFEFRRGLGGQHPLIGFQAWCKGHRTVSGMECYRIKVDGREFRVVKVLDGLWGQITRPTQDFCVVALEHYVRLYRFLRRSVRRDPPPAEPCPIMQEDAKSRLWDNSIGFLQKGSEVLKRYGVAQKRGLLLIGEPGNGKTMACRWLYSHCRLRNLQWRHVRAEEYENARSQGMAQYMFQLEAPGIVLFDDFDLGVRNRDEVGPSSHHSTFLGELDGVEINEGVVYLFTTNAQLSQLDRAFLRPGRIDQVIPFPRPDADLRRDLVRQYWHADITGSLDVDEVIARTEGLSFAEIEELKKLLVLRYLDAQKWDWDWAWNAFHQDERREKPPRRFGFDLGLPGPADRSAVGDPLLNEL